MRRTRHQPAPDTTRFILWREVAVAYLAPALIAGLAGLLSGQANLLISAGTSIGISSAIVAALIGTWLQRRGRHHAWLTSRPRLVPVASIAVGAALTGGGAGWLINTGAAAWLGAHPWPWPDGLGIDLPVSAAIAATIVTWRWCAATAVASADPAQARPGPIRRPRAFADRSGPKSAQPVRARIVRINEAAGRRDT